MGLGIHATLKSSYVLINLDMKTRFLRDVLLLKCSIYPLNKENVVSAFISKHVYLSITGVVM